MTRKKAVCLCSAVRARASVGAVSDLPVLSDADRADDKVKFTDDALQTVLAVPRVFLPLVLKGCVDWAKENGVERITAEHMQIINDKRAKEKNKK